MIILQKIVLCWYLNTFGDYITTSNCFKRLRMKDHLYFFSYVWIYVRDFVVVLYILEFSEYPIWLYYFSNRGRANRVCAQYNPIFLKHYDYHNFLNTLWYFWFLMIVLSHNCTFKNSRSMETHFSKNQDLPKLFEHPS